MWKSLSLFLSVILASGRSARFPTRPRGRLAVEFRTGKVRAIGR